MAFWSTLLYILLFIVFLSALIMVHEAGHLIAAKAFKVYCFEYSIGFGPKLFSKKRKNGETKFSIRAIPFGGYVSMYGEADEAPEGENIPPERSLANIKRWKRIVILFAGVFMNAVLAFVIFFASNCFCEQQGLYARTYAFNQDSLVYSSFAKVDNAVEVKGSDGKTYYCGNITFVEDTSISGEYPKDNTFYLLANDGVVTYVDTNKENTNFLVFLRGSSISSLSVEDNLYYIPYKVENEKKIFDFSNQIKPDINIKNISYSLQYTKEDKTTVHMPLSIGIEHVDTSGTSSIAFKSLNMSFETFKFRNDFPTAWNRTLDDYGRSASAIFTGFASLFSNPGEVSGIIGIGVVSTQVLQNNGWANYLFLWGMISVNLAIVNLFPFPGLDGWHIFVNIVEGITRKEIPAKAKTIASLIGMVCLFALMAVLVVSDIFKFLV